MQKKWRLAIVGAGKLGSLVARAWLDGLLPDYELAGVLDRDAGAARALADRAGCAACDGLDALLALQPDYVVEAAAPAVVREIAERCLRGGANLVLLSIGAFADAAFYEKIAGVARECGRRVHLASGAIGGFDVLRATALMGGANARISTEKGPASLKGTPVFEESLMGEGREVFAGTAKEAIALFPTKVNVAVATALATVGPEQTRVRIRSTPGYVGDDHRIEAENDEVRAVVDIYSKTSAIAGWSVVALLQNLTSPIVF